MSGRLLFPIAVVMSVVLVTPLVAQARAPAGCHASHYAKYAATQRDYHRTLERLAVRADAGLGPIAAIARADQVARVDVRERAVQLLLASDRTRLRLDRPVNQWLDWGPDEATRLAQVDPVIAQLIEVSRLARQRAAGHGDWERLRATVQNLQRESAHSAAQDRITALIAASPRC